MSPCRIVAAVFALCAGCYQSVAVDAETDGGGGIGVDEYCDEQADVLCRGWQSCCSISDLPTCLAWMVAECEAGEISSVRAGEAVLDGEVARRCLDAYAQDMEDCVQDQPLGELCRYRWYGDARVGEPCRDVWHCERGLGCVLEGTAGTCIELPTDGTSCALYGACQAGLYCSYEDWMCRPEPRLGAPCEREHVCAQGACVDGTCQAVSFCR